MNRRRSAVLVAALILFALGPHASARQGGAQAIKAEQNLAIDVRGRVVDVTFDGDLFVTAPWDRVRFDLDIVQPLTRDGGAFLGDLSGDGIPDLILAGFSGETLFFPGVPGSPRRFGNGTYVRQTTATQEVSPYDFTGAMWMTGDVGDLDGDGIKEVAIGSDLFRSVGTPDAPTLDHVYTFSGGGVWDPAASFGDLDGDGKIDVVISYGYTGGSWVFWNTSTPGSLSFTGASLGAPGGASNRLALADLNGDELLDLAGAAGIYFNTGSAQTPAFNFSAPSPWNLAGAGPSWVPGSDQGTNVFLKDADGDGLLDAYVSNTSSTVWQVLFYKNTGTSTSHQLTYIGPVVAAASPVNTYYRGQTTPSISGGRAYAAAGDIDQNGLSDVLLSGSDVPAILWSRPRVTGSPLPPTRSFQDLYTYPAWNRINYYCGALYSSNPRDAICDPPNWFSAWTDLTGDGLQDAIRTGFGYVDGVWIPQWYRQARSGSWPFTLASDSAILTTPAGTQAAGYGVVVVDIDMDGRPDIVTGSEDGRLLFYRDTAASGAMALADPVPLTDSVGTAIDVGDQSWPTPFDLDGDGDTDFLVADKTGTIRQVTCATPGSVQGYAAGALLGSLEQAPVDITGVVGGGTIVPSLTTTDVDGDGLQDVVMADVSGRVWLLRNVGSSGSPGFSLGPLTISRTAAAYMEVVNARTVRLYFGLPVTPGQTVLGYHDVPAAGSPSSGELVVSPDADNAGVLTAAYDSTLKAPACASAGAGCDSAALLNGVGAGNGYQEIEANQPNTLFDSCADGPTYTGEAIERIRVTTVDGGRMMPGTQARIEVTALASSTSNKIDLYYTDNANAPSWTFLTTLSAAGGLNVFTTTYTLPALATGAPLQALRAHLRFGSSATSCSTAGFDDHDDLAFALGGNVTAPADVDGDRTSDAVVWRADTGTWYARHSGTGGTTFTEVQCGAQAAGDIQVPGDYDGDGKMDIAVWRPSTGVWRILKSGEGYNCATALEVPFGSRATGDAPVPADYDGDGTTEIAVFRPTTGEWLFEDGSPSVAWGMRGDIPSPADYNGDGVVELAVFRPTTGGWYVRGGTTLAWGMWGDVPVAADYNGDGAAEIAVYRPSTGWWYVAGGAMAPWGTTGDVPVPLDTDGDGASEFVVYRPGTGTWHTLDPVTSATSAVAWGQAGDEPLGVPLHLPAAPVLTTAGDFDHDGSADITVFRPSSGTWYTLDSTFAYRSWESVALGQAGDIPVPGDYQGTGRQARAVYRPATGQWLLEDGRTVTLGAAGDVPVPGDYDGDGTTDVAVFTPSSGQWSILTGASGFATLVFQSWGASGDVPAPGDYDGDAVTDFAVFTPATGVWTIRGSATGTTLMTVPWGMSGDIPVPADYDGDGTTDIAVYRPSTGYWYELQSGSGWSFHWAWWGAPGDIAVPGDFDGDGKTDVAVYRPSTGAWYAMNVLTVVGWGEVTDVAILGRQ